MGACEDAINREHIGMTASRRAFDQAFLDLLQLDMPLEKVYSSSSSLSRKTAQINPEKASGEPSGPDAAAAETVATKAPIPETSPEDTLIPDDDTTKEFGIGSMEEIELEPTDVTPLPDSIELSIEKKSEPVDFEKAKVHRLSFNCAQKGKTLQEIFDAGKVDFLRRVLKLAESNDDMKPDVPYVSAFLNGSAKW